MPRTSHKRLVELLVIVTATTSLLLTACNFAPKYSKPTVQAPVTYKELKPENLPETDGWKVARPSDDAIHDKWWETFGDSRLNALEDQVSVSNQNVIAAAAAFVSARALVRQARAQYYPTVSANPSISYAQVPFGTAPSGGSSGGGSSSSFLNGTFALYSLPFDASWQPDLWGRVRNTVRANIYGAQASAADLENVRLTMQAELAQDYFQLRAQDNLKQVFDETVKAYQESLKLTQDLFKSGLATDEAVAQAETLLETTRAQDTNLGILRAQFEHAIAMLVGQPASSFSIGAEQSEMSPPAVPFGVPSQLLERRPDIAAAERTVAQANARIGVAKAAYYPNITLSASGGFESTSITSWLTWPSRFWSLGPSLSETIFEAGSRNAGVVQTQAVYDQTVANYRQTVLTAFQQIEDNLAALRILSQEAQEQNTAIGSAERTLGIATSRYKAGIDPYLNVITAQAALLANRQTLVTLRMQQMTASVQLIEALGGGWDASRIPTPQKATAK